MSGERFNGKTGEWLRWALGMVLAGVVAYFTSIGTVKEQVATVQERENNHFSEVLRRLDVLQADMRELRERVGR